MSEMSDYLENKLLDEVLFNTAFAAIGTVYIGLFTTDPTDDASGTEVPVANAYVRQSMAFDAASGGVTQNTSAVTFPTASGGNWGAITHIALFDAEAAGNHLFHTPLTASKVVNDGDTFKVNSGDLTVTLA